MKNDISELGTMITDIALQRQSDDEITIADLTGVAIEDIQISKAVFLSLES
jgi:ornithine cyclodeaminase